MSFRDIAVAEEGGRRQAIVPSECEEAPEMFIRRRHAVGDGKLQDTKEQARRPTIQELMSQERRRLIRCVKLAN